MARHRPALAVASATHGPGSAWRLYLAARHRRRSAWPSSAVHARPWLHSRGRIAGPNLLPQSQHDGCRHRLHGRSPATTGSAPGTTSSIIGGDGRVHRHHAYSVDLPAHTYGRNRNSRPQLYGRLAGRRHQLNSLQSAMTAAWEAVRRHQPVIGDDPRQLRARDLRHARRRARDLGRHRESAEI